MVKASEDLQVGLALIFFGFWASRIQSEPEKFSGSRVLRLGSQVLGFSGSGVLRFSGSQVLGFSDSQVLGFSGWVLVLGGASVGGRGNTVATESSRNDVDSHQSR